MSETVLVGGLDVAEDRIEIPVANWCDASQGEKSPAAQRKAEQRQRDAAAGVVELALRLGPGEAAMLAESRVARGSRGEAYTTTEYINTLIRRDHELLQQQRGIVEKRLCESCRKALPRGCGGVWRGELSCAIPPIERAMEL